MMHLWWWLLGTCVLGYGLKLVGYLIPGHLLDHPQITRIAGCMTIGLLAALTVVNTCALGQRLTVDARLVALAVAVVALLLRAPFIVVVILGAVAAALARLAGLP